MSANIRRKAGWLVSVARNLDMFGEAVDVDPARFQKTPYGLLASIICIAITIVLVVFDAIRLSESASESDTGTVVVTTSDRVKVNGLFTDSASGTPFSLDMSRWDLPTLVLEAGNDIEFYSAGRRFIHKVEIVDNTGYQPWLTSNQDPATVT
eukprot:CAMPEP_0113684746 /NCGR_PEP_ID=MMETSP0038_2-20120614/14214_1 /TAXON_ID=2898 /ORGANISM="Cryptomonas paramecium" /LENGTH=151 /DNA_ID=CAMNT_0000604609 /DNA_START=81 /DNA_END=532 /DNA_ORIENTATION=- /assembly_acc=CAM_ASM_000170